MSADSIPVALFARAPVPGRAKTRLAPALGLEGAAALYRAFLQDTLAKVAEHAALAPILWAASDDDAAVLRAELARDPIEIRAQPELDLGARMNAALEQGIARSGRALVLGTDAPTLPKRLLDAAAAALDRADVVLGPAVDGGYWLLGVRERVFPLDAAVRWSTPHALADTLERARRAGRSIALLGPWYDVDTPDDLRLLRAHLALRPSAAPASARALGYHASFDRTPKLQ